MVFWTYFITEEFLKWLNDLGTLVIAIVNVFLVFYIFTYQREKDKKDRRLIIRQVNLNVKADWFKSLILEPNISFLHEFYKEMRALFEDYTGAQKSLDSSLIMRELNQNCNNIEFRFLTILGSVDQALESDCIQIADQMRDELANLITVEETNFQKYNAIISFSKKEILSALYHFVPQD